MLYFALTLARTLGTVTGRATSDSLEARGRRMLSPPQPTFLIHLLPQSVHSPPEEVSQINCAVKDRASVHYRDLCKSQATSHAAQQS